MGDPSGNGLFAEGDELLQQQAVTGQLEAQRTTDGEVLAERAPQRVFAHAAPPGQGGASGASAAKSTFAYMPVVATAACRRTWPTSTSDPPAREEIGGQGMPEPVRPHLGHPVPMARRVHHHVTPRWAQGHRLGDGAQEHRAALCPRTATPEDAGHRGADVGRERESIVTTALTVHDQLPGSPIDVVEGQPGDLAGPQPEACQHQQDGVVPPTQLGPLVAARQHSGDGQVVEPAGQTHPFAAGHRRHRLCQGRLHHALQVQEAQERPQRSRQVPRCRPAAAGQLTGAEGTYIRRPDRSSTRGQAWVLAEKQRRRLLPRRHHALDQAPLGHQVVLVVGQQLLDVFDGWAPSTPLAPGDRERVAAFRVFLYARHPTRALFLATSTDVERELMARDAWNRIMDSALPFAVNRGNPRVPEDVFDAEAARFEAGRVRPSDARHAAHAALRTWVRYLVTNDRRFRTRATATGLPAHLTILDPVQARDRGRDIPHPPRSLALRPPLVGAAAHEQRVAAITTPGTVGRRRSRLDIPTREHQARAAQRRRKDDVAVDIEDAQRGLSAVRPGSA